MTKLGYSILIFISLFSGKFASAKYCHKPFQLMKHELLESRKSIQSAFEVIINRPLKAKELLSKSNRKLIKEYNNFLFSLPEKCKEKYGDDVWKLWEVRNETKNVSDCGINLAESLSEYSSIRESYKSYKRKSVLTHYNISDLGDWKIIKELYGLKDEDLHHENTKLGELYDQIIELNKKHVIAKDSCDGINYLDIERLTTHIETEIKKMGQRIVEKFNSTSSVLSETVQRREELNPAPVDPSKIFRTQ